MPLASVLSAVKELILAGRELPVLEAERRIKYRYYFPNLSPEELEGLAKILPAQLRAYTSSIVSGEKGTLYNLFPITFKLLQKYWEISFGEIFDPTAFIQDMNSKFPWKGYATEVLAANFVSYISSRHDLGELVPYLQDVGRIEYLSMKVRRHLPEPVTKEIELSGLTVEELLSRNFIIKSSTVFQEFYFDVVGLYWEEMKEEDLTLPPLEEVTLAYCARNTKNRLRWGKLSSEIFDYLQKIERNNPVKIEEFAEVAVSAVSTDALSEGTQGLSEEDLFQAFYRLLHRLMEDGVLHFI